MDWSLIGGSSTSDAPAAAGASDSSGSGWGDFLGKTLQNGISRVVDAEITKEYSNKKADPLFANENGQGGVAGKPAGTLTAPTVTVMGVQTSPLMLAAGAAAVLLVAVLLLRR